MVPNNLQSHHAGHHHQTQDEGAGAGITKIDVRFGREVLLLFCNFDIDKHITWFSDMNMMVFNCNYDITGSA